MTSGRGGRRRLGFDGEVAARAAAAALLAPWLVWKKARKVARNPAGHADEIDRRRWLPRRVRADGPGVPRDRGPHVAFVGKSFGELRLIEALDAALRARVPGARTTWCGQKDEFFAAVARRRPAQPVAAIPFEGAPSVAGWLRNVAPDLVVLVERMNLPVLVHGCASAGVRLAAVNAVAPRRDATGGLRGRLEARARRRLLSRFAAICFQSEEQAARAAPFLPASGTHVVTGNLKVDVPAAGADDARDASLDRWIARRAPGPLFVAGSTRRGDEAFVLDAFLETRRAAPCALLIAPRQPERTPEVEALVARAGLSASRRTAPHPGTARPDVLLLDTIGELPRAYDGAAGAFVGGTLRHLGQNVVEPLQRGLPAAFGPAPVLLDAEQRACEAAGAGVRVRTPAELAAHWTRVAVDDAYRDAVRAAAAAVLAGRPAAMAATADVLARELERAVPVPAGARV